jgi:hypothetical protein
MGRTIPTFSMAIEHEKRRWKPFRNALYDKSDRKYFDDMFDIPRSYTSACSASVQVIRIHPILMSIILHEFKQLTDCTEKVKELENRVKEIRVSLERGESLQILRQRPQQSPQSPELERLSEEFISLSPIGDAEKATAIDVTTDDDYYGDEDDNTLDSYFDS